MNEQQAFAYVQASASVLGLALDPARARRVAGHLQRTAALAELLEQQALNVEDEPAEVYCPGRPAPGQA